MRANNNVSIHTHALDYGREFLFVFRLPKFVMNAESLLLLGDFCIYGTHSLPFTESVRALILTTSSADEFVVTNRGMMFGRTITPL